MITIRDRVVLSAVKSLISTSSPTAAKSADGEDRGSQDEAIGITNKCQYGSTHGRYRI